MVDTAHVPAKGKTSISLNIDPELLARVDKYRFKRMLASRTEAIELFVGSGV